MTNSKKISIALITSFFLLSGCFEDFLENPPLGQVTDANFLSTSSDAVLATNGVYNTLRIWFFHEGGFPTMDIMSDDATKGSNPGDGTSTVGPFENFTHTPSTGAVQNYWTALYQGIKRANYVLERLPDIQIDESLKNRLLGETYFLRGYFYFNLVRTYGDVPLVTSLNPPRSLTRTTVDQIYDDIIIPDLEFAISNLPERSEYAEENLGRATKGAAKGMLAKVYLFRNDFVKVEQLALEVINSGQYSLDSDFSHVFSVDGENGPGSVFEIGALPENSVSAGGNQYANTWGVRGTPNLGWGFGRPTLDLMDFMDNDPRMDATIVFLGEVIDGVTISGDGSTPDETFDQNGNLVEIEAYNQKTFVASTQGRDSFGHNRRVLRYADILLIAAEAANENGNSSSSLQYLNMVRQRAGVVDITETNQGNLRQIILDERRRELALEGHRFWDLVRTGNAEQELGPLGFVSGKHELWPIPQSEIDITEGSLIQNPGW